MWCRQPPYVSRDRDSQSPKSNSDYDREDECTISGPTAAACFVEQEVAALEGSMNECRKSTQDTTNAANNRLDINWSV